MDADFAVIWERLYQTHDVALESHARSKRRRACRNSHRLISIDAVSYGIIAAGTRKRCTWGLKGALSAMLLNCSMNGG